MKKSQVRDLAFKGQITAFTALIFVLMLSVVGALIESASIQMTKSRKHTDTQLALESTFAEYHSELLKQYEIFARFGCTKDVLAQRLSYYGEGNMEHRIKQIQLLTDHEGAAFYAQAINYVKQKYGMEDLSWGTQYDVSSERNMEEEEDFNRLELEEMLGEREAKLPEEGNPLVSIDNLRKSNLLSILVSDQEELSNRSINIETLPSKRELQKGNYPKEDCTAATDSLFFLAYVTEHFGNITNANEGTGLLYEQEYLLGGGSVDRENLEAVCKKIMNIRTVANYTYLLTDSTKLMEAEAMALTLCSFLASPQITQIVKYAILYVWAYGESIVDTRVLLKGKKLPLVKTGETWQLQLSNLSSLGTEHEVVTEKDSGNGISYGDYVKGLLLLQDTTTLSMRCLDLVENNLQIKTDQCMTRVEIESTANLRRGIREIFTTTYTYE